MKIQVLVKFVKIEFQNWIPKVGCAPCVFEQL